MKLSFQIALYFLCALIAFDSVVAETASETRGNKDLMISQIDENAKATKEISTKLKTGKRKTVVTSHPTKNKEQTIEDEIASYSVMLDYYSPGESQESLGYSVIFPELNNAQSKEESSTKKDADQGNDSLTTQ